MNKVSFCLLLLGVFALTASAQNGENQGPPPMSQDEQSQVTSFSGKHKKDWYCDFEFYYNGKPYYYESLDYDDNEASRGKLSKKIDNKIDSIYWSGSKCDCWVVVYQSKYWKGLNLGMWTDSNDGYYDLKKYITYDWVDGGWEPWYKTVSSYSIYCY